MLLSEAKEILEKNGYRLVETTENKYTFACSVSDENQIQYHTEWVDEYADSFDVAEDMLNTFAEENWESEGLEWTLTKVKKNDGPYIKYDENFDME